VIILTRLGNGMQIALNPDLIERAEPTPDTVITLVDGHKLVVQEPVTEVVALIRAWRASVAAEAVVLARLNDDPEIRPATRHDGERSSSSAHHDAVLSDKAAQASPLGRVLRLPAREV
jgi:flagellar protein FlbD